MDAYLGLSAVQHQQVDDTVDAAQPEMSCSLIEKVVKKLSKPHKGHRCIMEQEHAYLDEIIVAIIENYHCAHLNVSLRRDTIGTCECLQ
jgi:hypothetical protein